MQPRRKKHSLVDRPGGLPSFLGPDPITASPLRTSPDTISAAAVLRLSDSGGANSDSRLLSSLGAKVTSVLELMAAQDPFRSSPLPPDESRLQKSSVVSMYQDSQSAGDAIEMRLLALDEAGRSGFIDQLLSAFEHKVDQYFDHYKPELTLTCLRIVTSLSGLKARPKLHHPAPQTHPEPNQQAPQSRSKPHHPAPQTRSEPLQPAVPEETAIKTQLDPFADLDVEEALTRELPNFSVSRLRETVQQLLRRATLRQDGTLYFTGSPEDSMATKSVQYFIWYFDFMDLLHELFISFVEKILNPLLKYFQENHFIKSSGRTHSVSSAFSKVSQFSLSDTQASADDPDASDSEQFGLNNKRARAQATSSLLQLGKEYKDIRSIYDTSDVDKVVNRLCLLKEQLEVLLDEEDEIDPELYSAESGRMIESLNMDFGTENLIRLVPDILVKLKKSAWLARRWLQLYDQRTVDVQAKLEKLAHIEERLVKRLDLLHNDIAKGEKQLERDTLELNRLMDKEGRPDSLSLQNFSLGREIENAQSRLDQLTQDRETFAPRLAEVVRVKDLEEFHKLKLSFETNKLQRFVLGRRLATLTYHQQLLSEDLRLELLVRPSLIHSSNKLQDDCERLEKHIRQQKEELVTIKQALLPIQIDKESLVTRISRQPRLQPRGGLHPAGQARSNKAEYIRSDHKDKHLHTRPPLSPISVATQPSSRTRSPPLW